MNLMDYIDFVKERLKEAHAKNDKAEFVRLLNVLKDTIDDYILKSMEEVRNENS